LDEVYTFFPIKISKKSLKYTPPQYSIGRKVSKRKLQNWPYRSYIKLLSLFPQIKLVGLSGSISMMNASEEDDIDLFIITAKNRLFTGRFIALVLAQILRLRRSRDSAKQFLSHESLTSASRGPLESEKIAFASSHQHKNKVCLNLFFDESNLKVPKFKQTEFVGHEVLQMKPIIIKSNIYERFLKANEWVFRLFPNATPPVIPVKTGIQSKITLFIIISNKVEQTLKSFQLYFINKHKTTEIITSSQLWFHPDDFGKKIKF